eukprot:TRINITY_DN3703_c0_g1_i1.p1 TRINITY_DN3703_c0_g1~~TRINITY_DN3703_c0_g1_i1.p1  ORF type:complete len:139 (+),score=27.36 TRINITY_DN3703_c0_g1_i1:164-580(+)
MERTRSNEAAAKIQSVFRAHRARRRVLTDVRDEFSRIVAQIQPEAAGSLAWPSSVACRPTFVRKKTSSVRKIPEEESDAEISEPEGISHLLAQFTPADIKARLLQLRAELAWTEHAIANRRQYLASSVNTSGYVSCGV